MRHLITLTDRLDTRGRRMLMFACTAGMAFSAASTVTALQSGAVAEMLAGAATLAVATTGAALAWTGLRAARR